jgi:enoyl-CoA hydratase/carnithine racemase
MNIKTNPLILKEQSKGVCTLKFDRPNTRNPLSLAMMRELSKQLQTIQNDPSIKVVVITGSGSAFCSGHDLKELQSTSSGLMIFSSCSNLMMQIIRLKKPVIAQVNGAAAAAGCQLVATSDLAISGSSAKFSTPGIDIGLFCTTPAVALSRSVPHKKAMEMLLTGDSISAQEAKDIGLINQVVGDEKLEQTTNELALKLAQKPAHVLSLGKEAFYRQLEQPISESYEYASSVMNKNLYENDCIEGIQAFLQKRKPIWE